jgi:hypothetical protein
MSNKFKSEDFFHAISAIESLGTFQHDLGDYLIRNSDKYKEACVHLHKDMLEQDRLVVDMDSFPTSDKIHPFKLSSDELLVALQTDKPHQKRMLSITRYESPECDGETEEMIIVPLIEGASKDSWRPVGIVLFIRELDDPDKMQIRTQEFPGAAVPESKMQQIGSVILDAVNMIATALSNDQALMTLKTPSKLKLERAGNKELKPFTLMSLRSN